MRIFPVISFLFFIGLLSCVSQKKYNEKVAELAQSENRVYHLKQDSVSQQKRIDSLAQRVDSLIKDSMEMAAKLQDVKKNNSGNSSVVYYKQTITEEKEYQLKTVFMYNISVNTEWEDAYKTGDFVIGVLGKSKITAELKKGLSNKKKSGQTYNVVEFTSLAAIKNCHI